MNITYRDTKSFNPKDLEDLFLSVEWKSGNQPEKLAIALKNYGSVFTAWDEDRLVGLISAMDDGILTAYVHYLCVNPTYQKQGIGRQLIKMAENYYKDYMRVLLISYNPAADFYKKCGLAVMENCSPMYFTEVEKL